MAITGLPGMNITPPSPRTFQWGERGTIEMKPMEDVVYSSLAPGGLQARPIQSEQSGQERLPDPYAILDDKLVVDLQQIENEFNIADAKISKTTNYKLKTLEEEFEIQDRRLQDKFLKRIPAGKTKQDQLNEYNEAKKQLIAQKQVAALRLQNKIRPDRDNLAEQKQRAISELQANITKKKIELDMIQKLVDTGKIQDPIMGLQQQYEETGLNVPLSYLRPDPVQELRDLRQLIEYFKNKMDISKSIKEEYGQTLLPPGELEMFNKATKRHRELMLQQHNRLVSDPNFVDHPRLSEANRDLVENKGGTIGSLVGGSKITKTLDKTGAMTILQEAGGNKELARQIAASRGYKF